MTKKDETYDEKKPEAIKLAEWAEWFLRNVREPLDFRWTQMEAMAKELRRLNEENQGLQAAITLRSILGKSSPETNVVVTTDENGRCVAVTRQDEEGRILSVIWEAAEQRFPEQEPIAEVIESHVRPGLNGQYTAVVASPERLSVGAELFIHPQNLRCKSNQKRLATLWGYVKAEPLSEQQIAKAWSVAAGEHNASAVVKRRITQAIEKELGIRSEA